MLARCFYHWQPETVTAIYTENQRNFFQIWLQFHEDMCIYFQPRHTRYSLWSIVPFSHHWIPRYPINGVTKMFVHMSLNKGSYLQKTFITQIYTPFWSLMPLWIIPQFLNLRPKMAKIYCICDNAYHKQEPCFPLSELGQIVIWAKTYQPLDQNWPCTVIIYPDWQLWNYPLHRGWDCAISFLLCSIVKSQSLTAVIFMTKEYSDMSLCMGGKIRL